MPIDIFEAEGINHKEPIDIFEAEGFSMPKKNKKEPESFAQKAGQYAKTFNRSVEEIPQALLEMGAGAGQGLANTGAGINRLLTKVANLIPGVNLPEGPTVDIAPNKLSSKLGEFGGSMAGGGALLKGLNAIRGIPTNIGTDIAKNAFAGSAMSPEDQGLGALLGGGGAALGNVFGKAIPKITGEVKEFFKPGSKALQEINPEEVRESFESGKRLGRITSPAETTGNPWTGGIESAYKGTKKGSFENIKIGKANEKKEREIINNFLHKVYDKEVASDNNIKDLYAQAYKWNLKPDVVNNLKKDPIIAKAFKEAKKDPAWQSALGKENISENNYAFLDKVRDAIGNKADELRVAGSGKKSNPYQKQHDRLTEIMDNSVPTYEKARNAAELKITRRNLEKELGKNFTKIDGKEFFNKFIKNTNKYDELKNHIRKAPEASKMLEDMKKSWHSLIRLPDVSKIANEKRLNIGNIRNALLQLAQTFKEFMGVSDSKKALQYLNGETWFKDLEKSYIAKDKNRLENTLSGIIGKILPGGFNAIKEEE